MNVDKKKFIQFTKIIISLILISGVASITWSYILASIALVKYGSFQPLEALSARVCAVIIAAILSYSLKSFFETYAEKKNELDLIKHMNESDDNFIAGTPIDVTNNDTVG